MDSMQSPYPYAFEGTVAKFGVGKARKIWYNVVFLPEAVRILLPFDGRRPLRVEGEIANVPIANAFMPTGDGRYYVIVAPNVLKDGNVRLGDEVEVRFRIADQNKVDVPDALRLAIERDKQSAKSWEALTPGKKRMLAQHVATAKTPAILDKRIAEVLEALALFGGDMRDWRRNRG
jgi:predicted thioredoxin/glutaredoxin